MPVLKYFDPNTDTWKVLTSGGGTGSGVYTDDEPPADPEDGMLWFDTDEVSILSVASLTVTPITTTSGTTAVAGAGATQVGTVTVSPTVRTLYDFHASGYVITPTTGAAAGRLGWRDGSGWVEPNGWARWHTQNVARLFNLTAHVKRVVEAGSTLTLTLAHDSDAGTGVTSTLQEITAWYYAMEIGA